MNVEPFFKYARARYQLMLDRETNLERPWTKDPILQQYRFCNVFREDDKTTKWIRKHITFEKYGKNLLGAMVIARWFNRIETLELMLPPAKGRAALLDDLFGCWATEPAGWASIMRMVLKNQKPLVTGAYMIKTPAKMNKLEGLIWCIEQFIEMWNKERMADGSEFPSTLQAATDWLARSPYLGPFMAYEVVTDLRHTKILCNAPDIMTWANPGPGAARGAGRVARGDPDCYKRHRWPDVDSIQSIMRKLLKASQSDENWPRCWPTWEMRDVEHSLCEYDKYTRARLGQGRPKQRFAGGET